MHNKKLFCFVSALFHPHLGGVERYTYQFAKSLVLHGHEVIILTTNTDQQVAEEIMDGIYVYRLPIISLFGNRYPILKYNDIYFKIIKTIKAANPDVFIINTRFYITSILGLMLSKSINKPAIVIEHGSAHLTVSNRFLDYFIRLTEHLLIEVVKRYKPKFYGVSKACCDWLKHFGVSPAGILYNGIDTNYSIKTKTDLRNKYNIPQSTLIISFIGRLIEEKGILEFLNAIDLLKDKRNFSSCFFFIAGSGPLSSLIKKVTIHNKNVNFLGPLQFDEVMNLLANTDIFIFPTNYPEGLPTIILEAGISKCAVISTSKGCSLEVISDEEHGIIIQTNSAKNIKEAIERYIENPQYRIHVSSMIYEKVISEFSWKELSNKFLNTL